MSIPRNEITVVIGGASGDGSGSATSVFLRSCSRRGLHVFASYNYQSLIRGGHIYWKARIGNAKVPSQGDHVHCLLALNQDSISIHGPEVEPGGGVLFNSDRIRVPEGSLRDGASALPLPVGDLTAPFGRLPILQNTLAVGALGWLVGIDFAEMEKAIRRQFKGKDSRIREDNVSVCRAGHDHAAANFKRFESVLSGDGKARAFLSGNEALGLGLLAGGCRFYAAYPMTPATSILHYLVANGPVAGALAKQAEDEVAVVNMTIGAAHMGVRAACGTSGGGFSLMSEGMGLAGMLEDPIVVIDVQRGGPATGLPTKTEQADLPLALGAGQGDYPRVLIAPLSVEDCPVQAARALNLAERYQNPVTVLSDLYLSEHYETVDTLDLESAGIDRGKLTRSPGEGFKRYEDSADGVSPRTVPGVKGGAFRAESDEHNVWGRVVSDVLAGLPESIDARRTLVAKRMRKLESIRSEMGLPVEEGPRDADLTLVGWGSSYRLLLEVMDRLNGSGLKTNVVAFRDIYPMRGEEVAAVLSSRKKLLLVEQNASSQLGRVLRAETGVAIRDTYLKSDGEPFEPAEIEERAREVAGHGRA